MIVYLRVVPGFGVAVEESHNPELRSRPLVIGGLPHQRGIVREANFVAQRCGVRSGMTLAQAHQQCPDGIFRQPDLSRYERVWDQVCTLLRRYTPLVEPVDMGEVACDVTGCAPFESDKRNAVRALAVQVYRSTGIAPSIGCASNKVVAQLASLYPEEDGVTVVEPGRERAFLADLPLSLLPGVDPHLALTFQVLGLTTVSHVAALSPSAMKQRFGVLGEQIHRYACGIDPRPVMPPPDKDEIVARYECEDGSIQEAVDGIRRLADICATELLERRAAGMLVGLRLIWTDWTDSLRPLPQGEESTQPALLPPPERPIPHHAAETPEVFTVPYRVHSMLPQPLQESAPIQAAPVAPLPTYPPLPPVQKLMDDERVQEVVSMVRTPIDTAPPLLDRARELLIRSWPSAPAGSEERAPRLRAIELKIGEFAKPSQLSFSDFDRLDETGTLQGLSTERRQVLTRHDETFQARYGRTAFLHLAGVDSRNILTERRFRWGNGLPWSGSSSLRKRS